MDFTFGNVFLANILEIVKCGSSSINGSTTRCEKVLCDLLNIFESQENVDDYMINKKYAQYVKEDERLRVELSTSDKNLECDKNSFIKDDNNNNEEDDKNKETNGLNIIKLDSELDDKLDSKQDKLDGKLDNDAINNEEKELKKDLINDKLAEKRDDDKLINAIKNKSANDDNQEPLNGKFESDSKQTSIETDYSNE